MVTAQSFVELRPSSSIVVSSAKFYYHFPVNAYLWTKRALIKDNAFNESTIFILRMKLDTKSSWEVSFDLTAECGYMPGVGYGKGSSI